MKHDLYHVEIRGYEGQPGLTVQISDSGSSGGIKGVGEVTLPRLRVNASGIFVGQQ